MTSANKKFGLFLAGGAAVLLLLCTCIMLQVGMTLGTEPGQGYLWAYLYLPVVLVGGLTFLVLSGGIHPPTNRTTVSRPLLMILGISVFIASVFFAIRAVNSVVTITTGFNVSGTIMLRSVTASLLAILGFATGLASVITAGKAGDGSKWLMLLITCFMLAFLIDQTAAILPMPDIAVYGPLVISLSLSILFFLELAKCKAGSHKPFRNALIFGWTGGICSLSGILLWFIYPGLFMGRMEPGVLVILLCTGIFMLMTSVRMIFLGYKT